VSELKAYELAVVLLVNGLTLLTLVGLVVRRHISTCWTFGLYLLAVLVTDFIMWADAVWWKTGLFYNRLFWLHKEILLNAIKFAIALEVAYRAFGSFPGARATAQFFLVLLLGVTLISVMGASGLTPQATESLAGEVLPRIITGTTWLFAVIAVLILWYRLPIAVMPKAILIGFVPFLIFSYLGLELQKANSWPPGWLAGFETWAYVVVLAYWARSAWQPFREIMPGGRRPVPAVQETAG
jgi:hypothetical protein